jgi:hypothetical protein
VKNLSSAFIAQLAQPSVQPVVFVQIAFANETISMWSGVGPFTPAGPATNPLSTFPYGTTFTGLGWLGKINSIPQTIKVQAQSITLMLSGIPAELVSDTVQHVRMNGTATVWVAFMNGEGALLSGLDPQQMFYGALDVPTLQDDGASCTLSITCENPLISLNLAPNRRFNDADQQALFAGDLGFSFVDALANQNTFWPSPAPNSSTYPNFLQILFASPDVAVGSTVQCTVKMTYSDGSTYSHPGGGSGSNFTNLVASSNPKIATIDPYSGLVTGVSPGECSIYARVTFYQGAGIPSQMYRAAGSIIVHG